MTTSKPKRNIVLIATASLVVLGLSTFIGLPPLVQGMGLHPEYEGQRYLLPEGRALIIATNHDELGDDGTETGVFGSELTAPYYEFQSGRMAVDVASIEGGEIPFDPALVQLGAQVKVRRSISDGSGTAAEGPTLTSRRGCGLHASTTSSSWLVGGAPRTIWGTPKFLVAG